MKHNNKENYSENDYKIFEKTYDKKYNYKNFKSKFNEKLPSNNSKTSIISKNLNSKLMDLSILNHNSNKFDFNFSLKNSYNLNEIVKSKEDDIKKPFKNF